MAPDNNLEISAFSKVLSIFVVVIIVVAVTALVTGFQIYWWQRAVAAKEKAVLQEKVVKLQNELKMLRTTRNALQKPLSSTSSQNFRKESRFKDILNGRAQKIISLLKEGNFQQLAGYVHPEKGLRFSPYSFVDLKRDRVFSAGQIGGFLKDNHRYIWGYNDENGMPIRLTSLDYYKKYIYDKAYADSSEISYLQNPGQDFTAGNCGEVYPKAIIVEYRSSEYDPKTDRATDWRSLLLALEEKEKVWYLVGIIHDQW